MATRLALLLALGLLSVGLTGCLADQEGPPCEAENVLPVAWHQPGLYDAIPVDDPADGWAFEQRDPDPGLPFHSETWAAALGPGDASLTRIVWASGFVDDAEPGELSVWALGRFVLTPDRGLSATLPADATIDEVREPFMTVTGSVTEADLEQREAWLERFMEARSAPTHGLRDGPSLARHLVRLDGPLATDALLGDPGLPDAAQEAMDVGHVRVTRGDWTFHLELPMRSVSVPSGTRLTRAITVDALDRVNVQLWQVPENATALQAVLDRSFQEAALPAPEIPPHSLAVPPGCQARYQPLAQGP